jgi:hypothetical protein
MRNTRTQRRAASPLKTKTWVNDVAGGQAENGCFYVFLINKSLA